MDDIRISSIDISEFRGIKRCVHPINFSKFNVLIGRNNSCKTAILEALHLFPDPNIRALFDGKNRPKSRSLEELHSGSNCLVFGYAGQANIKYTVLEKELEVILKTKDITDPDIILGGDSWDDSLTGLANEFNLDDQNLENLSLFLPNDDRAFRAYTEYLRDNEPLVIKNQANSRVVKFVNKCIDDVYSEVFWKEGGLHSRKLLENGNPMYVKIPDLGEGVKRAILSMLLLETVSPGIVLWDDFGSTDHPSLVRAELDWLSQKNWQVFLITHSIDVLYELLRARIPDTVVLQVSKSPDDRLIWNPLSIDDLQGLVNAHADPRLLAETLGM